jgi:hypothetical protein
MRKALLLFVVTLILASGASASEYKTFTRDLVQPYDSYKKLLSLTNKKEDAEKAKAAVSSFIEAWSVFAAKYASDVPKPFAEIRDFSAKITRPIEIGRQAAEYLKMGNVERAHSVLEEVRYLMWEMRITSNIVSLSDKTNDLHEAMEVVLDHAALAKGPEETKKVYDRYGKWFLIKWDDMINAPDVASVKKAFDPVFEDGRKAVAAYLDALKQGDVVLAKNLSGGVKGAYKKVWMLSFH